jgi:hypothetical protein
MPQLGNQPGLPISEITQASSPMDKKIITESKATTSNKETANTSIPKNDSDINETSF